MTRQFVLLWLFLACTDCRGNRVQDCYRSTTGGLYYRGTISKTTSGKNCLSWTSNDDYKPEDYPHADIDNHNYCRNPKPESDRMRPWCFIRNKEWEYCNVAECSPDTSCYSVIDYAGGYRGNVSRDEDNHVCMKWSASGSDLESNYEKSEFTRYGIGDHNYCRNPYPDKGSKPYCQYKTTDNNVKEEECNVSKCDDVPVISQTCGGDGGGKACKFPFTYDGYRFVECTNYKKISTSSWCATKLDKDGEMKEWGLCYCIGSTTPARPSTAVPSTAAPTTAVLSTAMPFTSTTNAVTTKSNHLSTISKQITTSEFTTTKAISFVASTRMTSSTPSTPAASSSVKSERLVSFGTTKVIPSNAKSTLPSKSSLLVSTTAHSTTKLPSTTSSQTKISSRPTASATPSRSESVASTTSANAASRSVPVNTDSKGISIATTTTNLPTSMAAAVSELSPTVHQSTTIQSETTDSETKKSVGLFTTASVQNGVVSQRSSVFAMMRTNRPPSASIPEKSETFTNSATITRTSSPSRTLYYVSHLTTAKSSDILPESHESEKSVSITLIAAPVAATGSLIFVIVIIVCLIRRRRHNRSGKLYLSTQHATETGVLNPTYAATEMEGEYVCPNSTMNVVEPNGPVVAEDGYLMTSEALAKSRKLCEYQTVPMIQAEPLLTSPYLDLIEDERLQVWRDGSCSAKENSSIYQEPAKTITGIYQQFEGRRYRKLDVSSIEIFEALGSGAFGDVHKAKWHKNENETKTVAVKTLNSKANEEDQVKFMQEAAIMGQFKHKHVVSLIGVVTEGDVLMVVLEFMQNGDLKQYLQDVRLHLHHRQETEEELQAKLLQMAREIASGMKYLSAKRFVHRDLAARNVMLDSEKNCKIGDFGLSRDIADDSYYQSKRRIKIPIRWTAPEALNFKKYSSASDVWSYGIVLYEIWSVGMRPYGERNNSDVVAMIDYGYRLPPPSGCPRPIYSLMIECWHPDHHKRPSFRDIVSRLAAPTQSLLTNSKREEAGGHVGDPLKYGEMLYRDLQASYKTK